MGKSKKNRKQSSSSNVESTNLMKMLFSDTGTIQSAPSDQSHPINGTKSAFGRDRTNSYNPPNKKGFSNSQHNQDGYRNNRHGDSWKEEYTGGDGSRNNRHGDSWKEEYTGGDGHRNNRHGDSWKEEYTGGGGHRNNRHGDSWKEEYTGGGGHRNNRHGDSWKEEYTGGDGHRNSLDNSDQVGDIQDWGRGSSVVKNEQQIYSTTGSSNSDWVRGGSITEDKRENSFDTGSSNSDWGRGAGISERGGQDSIRNTNRKPSNFKCWTDSETVVSAKSSLNRTGDGNSGNWGRS